MWSENLLVHSLEDALLNEINGVMRNPLYKLSACSKIRFGPHIFLNIPTEGSIENVYEVLEIVMKKRGA